MAVAAVVLVAGACGAGEGSGDGDGDGLRRLPLGAVGAGRSSATMSAEAGVAADDASASRMIAPFRAVEYRLAEDADAPPATADAYEVKSLPSDEVRSKIAKALRVDAGLVEVGTFGYDWYYSGAAPDAPVSSSAGASATGCAPDEKCEAQVEVAPRPTVPGVPTSDEAEARVREFLSALGASDDGTFEVFGEDGYNRSVVFTPKVDGIPVAGLSTQVAFGEDGRVEYANGLFAEVEVIGEYPLVGLEEAVERLQNGFGAGGGVATMGVEEDVAVDPTASATAEAERAERDAASSGGGSAGSAGSAGSGAAEPAVDQPACAPGEPCSTPPSPPSDEPTMTIEPEPAVPAEPLEPQIVDITGAELSLQLVAAGCPGDPVYLVPTFDLQSSDGSVGGVIAVEEDVIAGAGGDGDDAGFQPCPDQGPTDVPLGKPEPAPMPADAGREPATP